MNNSKISTQPIVSIIIATFNAQKFLARALDSVAAQTIQQWECLIMDGGSQDETVNILKQYASRDSRFRYISEPDKGIFDAFNKGWKLAAGEWILYLGADDQLLKNGLELLLNATDEHTDIVYGDNYLLFPNGKKKIRGVQKISAISYTMPSSHQSFIVRHKVFEHLQGFDLNFHILSDVDFIQRAWIAKFKFKQINDPIVIYSVGGFSTDNLQGEWERYRMYKKNKTLNWPFLMFLRFYIKGFLVKIKHKLNI